MAKFSQQFLKSMSSPGLFEMGVANLGDKLSDMRLRQRQTREAENIQQILQANINNPAKLQQLAQEYQIKGNAAAAAAFQDAANRVTAKDTAGKDRGIQGGLMAITQGSLRNIPLADPKGGEDLQAAVRSVLALGGTQEQITAAYEAGQEDKDANKGQTFSSAGLYKDSENNIYTATEVRTRGKGVEIDYSPVTPGAPEQPEGKLTPIGGAYSLSASERIAMEEEAAGRTTKAEGFAKSQQEAVDSLPKIEVAIGNAEQSLELLTQIKTGGFTTAVVRSAQQFLGVEPKTQAEFNLLAGKTVLDNLSKFEGAISEGERRYLENLYQSLERSGGANQGILESLLQEAQFYLADAQAKASASSYQNYLETRPTYSSVTAQQTDKKGGPQKVNFNDLK
jgi:hypothetical protein